MGMATFWSMLPSDGSVFSEGDTVTAMATHSMIAAGTDNGLDDAFELEDFWSTSGAMSGVAATCAALTLAVAATL